MTSSMLPSGVWKANVPPGPMPAGTSDRHHGAWLLWRKREMRADFWGRNDLLKNGAQFSRGVISDDFKDKPPSIAHTRYIVIRQGLKAQRFFLEQRKILTPPQSGRPRE